MSGPTTPSPLAQVALLAGLAAGHAAVALACLSRLHALGIKAKWLKRAPTAPLAPFALMAAWLGWLVLTRPLADWPAAAVAYGAICNVLSWAGIPASIVSRRLRTLPRGVTVRDEPVALDEPPGGPSAWIGAGRHHGMLRLPGNESLTLRATTAEMALEALPRGFGALRVLHITDLHFGPCYDRGYFEAVAAAAAGWEADLVVFTGDLIDDESTLDWTGPVLGRLRGRLGQYAILGNHDTALRPGRIRRALRAAGYTMLDGRWLAIEDGARTIALGGTSAPWGPGLDPEGRPRADATVVLSHSPDQFPKVASWGSVDLVLAGHNHGGQICLPGVGPIVMPSVYGLRYDRGIFRRGRTTMVLSRGVGGERPIRYGAPPEIVRLTLRPSQAGSAPFASKVRRIRDSTSRA